MSGPGSSGIGIDKLCAITCALYISDYGAWNITLFVFINFFFSFHSEELQRDNIAEVDIISVSMHGLKLGCITDVSEEYAFSCRATHRLFFQYSGTKIICWTQFIRNTILFPVFHVIGSFYCIVSP